MRAGSDPGSCPGQAFARKRSSGFVQRRHSRRRLVKAAYYNGREFPNLSSAACGRPQRRAYRPDRRRGRVAEGGGLLNRYRVVKPYRGFESLRLRQSRTELRTPTVADFTPEIAASVLSRSLFDPMMRTSWSATSTLWARARRWVAAIAVDSYSLAGRGCELAQHRRGDGLLGRAI
jgi:hypothetical protein